MIAPETKGPGRRSAWRYVDVIAWRLAMAAALLLAGCSDDPHLVGADRTLTSAIYAGTPLATWSRTVVALDNRCSGVLLTEELLVYAAHCGPFVSAVSVGDEVVAPKHCEVFPKAMPGGTDIAYCVLDHAIADARPILPALGCEADVIVAGAPATLVGYGYDGSDTGFGTVRAADSTIVDVSREIAVTSATVGTCAGDSGGPALVQVADADGATLRVAGVLSGAETADCVPGRSYYTPLWPFVSWIEESSGVDVSPCSDADGNWQPTSRCLSLAPDVGSEELVYSATCGEPFDPAQVHDSAPTGAGCSVRRASNACAGLPASLLVVAAALRRLLRKQGRASGCAEGCESPTV